MFDHQLLAVPAFQVSDGIGMNVATLAAVSSIVVGMAAALVAVWRWATANQRDEIQQLRIDKKALEEGKKALEEDKRALTDAVVDALRAAHRADDIGHEAGKELLRRETRTRRPP